MKNSKTFRLFVSSTFSDFAKERAVLQKKVFPEIKKYCASKGYTFQPIDLRWGVSNEAQLDQKTIELCLNEVRVCKTHPHPNFLIMAGDRYGWIPLPYMIERSEFEMLLESMNEDEKDEILSWYQLDLNQIPASYLLEKRTGKYEKWEEWNKVENSLREILQTKVTQEFQDGKITEALKRKYFMSATEAEVEEGIFDYLEPTEFQQKLFKKEKDLPIIDKNNIFGFFRNIKKETLIGNVFIGNDYERAQVFKGNAKKVLVAENILEISTTQKSEDILDESYLEKLEEKLFGFLKIKVDAHIENEKKYSEQEMKQQAQEYFIKEKTNNFIGRDEILGNIANYISDENTRPLAIYGTSGIGKSAIMAKAILQAKQQQQDKRIIFRFVGATADASSTMEVLIGLFDDLGIDIRKGKNKEEILQAENKPETLEDFSYRVHGQIMGLKDQVIIFIDAVDQLSNADQFLWLPKKLPQNVKIILSALEDEKYDEDTKYFQTLKSKTENILPIPQFEKPEQLLTDLLKVEGRTIQNQQKEIFIKQHEAIHSPLYIHIVAQEMKHWRSFEEKQTLANTQQDAIKKFIENLTQAYHHDERFVQKVFGYITASDGLSEDEIVDLLSIDKDFVKKMASETYHKNETGEFPLVIWARLYAQLKPFLGIRKEQGKDLLYFFHREFGSIVVDSAYQKHEHEEIIAATQTLIKKYQNETFDSNRWGKLYATLIVGYDLKYEDENKLVAYTDFISGALNNYDWIKSFCKLLNQSSSRYSKYNRTREAISCMNSRKIISEPLYLKNPDRWVENYTRSLNNLAILLLHIGKISEAIVLQKKTLIIRENLYRQDPERWAEDYTIILNSLAFTLAKFRKTSEAIAFHEKALEIIPALYQKNPDQWADGYVKNLDNLASILRKIGKTSEAIALLEKSLGITESLYRENPDNWVENYTRSLNNLGLSLANIGKTSEAMVLLEKDLGIAEGLYRENPEYWAEDYTTSLANLASLLQDIGKKSEAIALLEKSLGITESLYQKNPDYWVENYTRSLNNLGFSLANIGKTSEAIALQKKSLGITESLYQKKPDLWAGDYTRSINNLGLSLANIGKISEAIALQEKALGFVESLYQKNPDYWVEDYTTSLNNLAGSLQKIGKTSEAIALQEKSLGFVESLYQKNPDYWVENYTTCLYYLALSLRTIGKTSEAIALQEKSLGIIECLYKENPDRWVEDYALVLNSLVGSLQKIGKTSQAFELRKKSMEITEYLYLKNPDRCAKDYTTGLDDLALSLIDAERISEAIELLEKALEIRKSPYKEKLEYIKSLAYLYLQKGCQKLKEDNNRDLFWLKKLKLFLKMLSFVRRRMNGDEYAGTIEEEFNKFNA